MRGGGTSTLHLRDLEARNAALDAELARLRTELAMERATRSSLDRQVATLNERIAELRSQIDFLNAQASPSARDAISCFTVISRGEFDVSPKTSHAN